MLNFFKSGIWTLRTADFSPFLRGLVSALRIIVLSVRCFFKNNCMLHASALTYYTLLAIVPVAALAFAIAKGFGLYARLETWFRGTFAGKEEVAEKIMAEIGFKGELRWERSSPESAQSPSSMSQYA